MIRSLFLSVSILAANVSVMAQQTEQSIRFQRDRDVLFLNAADVASLLKLKLEIVRPGQLLTFCREGDGGICIPIRLTADNHRGTGKNLQLTDAVVRSSLQAEAVEEAGSIRINPLQPPAVSDAGAAPGYNAAWGTGRGFRQGDTLPDIPIVDMDGNEVRFSEFLGKRYILYCWASW